MPWPLKFILDNVLDAQPLPAGVAFFLAPLQESRASLLLFFGLSVVCVLATRRLSWWAVRCLRTRGDVGSIAEYVAVFSSTCANHHCA